jgi:hypothetical protein
LKKITGHIKEYFISVDKRILTFSSFFIALFIFINYYYDLNGGIFELDGWLTYAGWYMVFLIAFSFAYLLLALFKKQFVFQNRQFLFVFLLAPAIFSWKMVFDPDLHLSNNAIHNEYWNQVIYWPFKVVAVTIVLLIVWKLTKEKQPFYGMSIKDFSFKPYWVMLLIMVPLIAAASTQPDFLAMYPKLKTISFLNDHKNSGWYKILYELSYGSDFFTIELFFRGFLVLAFVKWVGKDAILPMALFYCTIHFGKPLGECISSYFGGLILGIVIYHTRTIFGGLMVHVGIAWLMELGGYLGNQ